MTARKGGEKSPPNLRAEWVTVPPSPDPLAWAHLYGSLIQAAEDDRAGLEYEGAPHGFLATEAALLAVIGFLQSSVGLMEAGAVLPLLRLATALRDLDQGSRPALLAARFVSKRPPVEMRRGHVIGFAARAMDRLMKAGDSANDAAMKVCAALKRGRAIGWQDAKKQTVMHWRARCMEGPGASVSPAAIAKFSEKLFRIEPPPAEEAKMLLQILSEANTRGLSE